MPLSHKTGVFEMSAEDGDRKDQGYGFILALLCLALALLVFSAIFTPVAIGSGVGNELYVGP
jgi:hypothetical protein